MDFTGYRRLSSSACNALPAIAGGTRLLAYVTCLYYCVAYPQQSLYAPLSLLSTCLLRRTSRSFPAFLCRLRLLHHPDAPPSTLGCVCMVGDSPCFSRGHSCSVLAHPRGELSLSLGHAAFSPCPYSVTGLAIGYIGDSYLLSGVVVLSRPSGPSDFSFPSLCNK